MALPLRSVGAASVEAVVSPHGRSRIEPLKRFAQRLKPYVPGILAHWRSVSRWKNSSAHRLNAPASADPRPSSSSNSNGSAGCCEHGRSSSCRCLTLTCSNSMADDNTRKRDAQSTRPACAGLVLHEPSGSELGPVLSGTVLSCSLTQHGASKGMQSRPLYRLVLPRSYRHQRFQPSVAHQSRSNRLDQDSQSCSPILVTQRALR